MYIFTTLLKSASAFLLCMSPCLAQDRSATLLEGMSARLSYDDPKGFSHSFHLDGCNLTFTRERISECAYEHQVKLWTWEIQLDRVHGIDESKTRGVIILRFRSALKDAVGGMVTDPAFDAYGEYCNGEVIERPDRNPVLASFPESKADAVRSFLEYATECRG